MNRFITISVQLRHDILQQAHRTVLRHHHTGIIEFIQLIESQIISYR